MFVKYCAVLAAVLGAAAVGAGAFGAHGLKAKLAPEMLAVYQTAVEYLFYHTAALFMVAISFTLFATHTGEIWYRWSAGLFLLGIVLFCGSLILLALGAPRILGVITPIGGLSFIVGWLCLAWAIHTGLREI